jgi:tRNA1Val (adenine37-N6)-methyltransferase
MKVNTDAVVLGALVAQLLVEDFIETIHALDVGTGSGILSLMLAQKIQGQFDAVDIDLDAAAQASENFSTSPWHQKLHVYNKPFLEFSDKYQGPLYDLIISNPPYFEPQNLRKGNIHPMPSPERAIARFEDAMPFAQLIRGVSKLITLTGSFFLILPSQRAVEFTALAVEERLYLHKQVDIISKSDKPPSRVVLKFGKQKAAYAQSTLTLHDASANRTAEFIKLTEDYYI